MRLLMVKNFVSERRLTNGISRVEESNALPRILISADSFFAYNNLAKARDAAPKIYQLYIKTF